MFASKLQPKSHKAQLISWPIHNGWHFFARGYVVVVAWWRMDTLTATPFIFVITGIIGACFGSFISLISYRMARDLPWICVRSRCPNCSTALSGRDLLPVISYLLAGRKCRHCRTAMSVRYVLTELITAACFMGLLWLKGPTLEFLLLAALVVCIITLIVTDLEHYMIPDTIQVALFLLGIAYVWSMGLSLDDRLLNAAVCFGIGLLLHYGYFWLMGKHGLGFGDVKLLASIGLWIPINALPVFLFLSGIIGILTALLWKLFGRGPYFPFGPALILTMLIMVLWPNTENLFHMILAVQG